MRTHLLLPVLLFLLLPVIPLSLALIPLTLTSCAAERLPQGFESDDAGAPPSDDSGGSTTPLPAAQAEADDASDDVTVTSTGFGEDDAGASQPIGPPFDAGPDGACAEPVGPGDLAIEEILIASLTGTGDHGEWLEVRSTRDCALDLIGLHAECAVGAKVNTVDATSDVWIPAGGAFVIADSSDPAVNHALPGLVLSWAGNPGDVLRNEGGTVTLLANGALVDSITYPSTKTPVGTSLAFPSDCALGARAEWGRWQPSEASWFPSFHGTPNGPNDDVHCPDD